MKLLVTCCATCLSRIHYLPQIIIIAERVPELAHKSTLADIPWVIKEGEDGNHRVGRQVTLHGRAGFVDSNHTQKRETLTKQLVSLW